MKFIVDVGLHVPTTAKLLGEHPLPKHRSVLVTLRLGISFLHFNMLHCSLSGARLLMAVLIA